MSLDEVRTAAKAAGSVEGLVKQGPVTYNLDTKDLGFQIEFTPDMHVRQYNVSARNPKHLKADYTSGPLYDKLVASFGPQKSWGQGSSL